MSTARTGSAPPDGVEPIDSCLDRWHRCLRGDLAGGLDEVLHPDCVFISPIVFRPQVGRELTKLYLAAAAGVLGGGGGEGGAGQQLLLGEGSPFRYTTEIRRGRQAMLEFETAIAGTSVNGVDIITCDGDGAIVELKVMLRPLQAINLVHERMRAALATPGDG